MCAKLGKACLEREEACLDPDVVADITAALAKHGAAQGLEKFEIPRALCLVAEPWTPESGRNGGDVWKHGEM